MKISALQQGGAGRGVNEHRPALGSSERGFSKVPAYGFGLPEQLPPYRPSFWILARRAFNWLERLALPAVIAFSVALAGYCLLDLFGGLE